MTTRYLLLSLFLLSKCSSLAQQSKCNKALIYQSTRLKSKLDSAICIPDGYHITDIYDDADLNNDGRKDKVVRYQRVKLSDGDTIYYSLYAQKKDHNLSLYKTFGNLEPLYFESYEFEDKTGNKFYDSIKTKYSYPTLSTVQFETNSINLTFHVDAATVKKLSFTYSLKEKTWILTRVIQWFVPPKNYEGDEKLDENGRKLEYDLAPETPIRIEEFDVLKYIGW